MIPQLRGTCQSHTFAASHNLKNFVTYYISPPYLAFFIHFCFIQLFVLHDFFLDRQCTVYSRCILSYEVYLNTPSLNRDGSLRLWLYFLLTTQPHTIPKLLASTYLPFMLSLPFSWLLSQQSHHLCWPFILVQEEEIPLVRDGD